MAVIELNNVCKRYGKTEVVKGIDLTINDGEMVVLVGPSGCGKSTTLRMIAGLEPISDGTIKLGGRVLNDVEPQHRNIAMVFQNYALYPHKTVAENIVFALKRLKLPKDEIDQRLQAVSKTLQISDYLHRKPADLSGGQRQRVAMGRAMIRDADAFLFDEPLSNLDAKLRNHMRTEIARIHHNQRRTSVYVTHDQVEAMTLADRVVVMRDGHIEQVGTPMAIFLDPVNTFVATFIGSPAMNLLPATLYPDHLKLGHFKLPRAQLTATDTERNVAHSGEPVTVGIRPDYFNDRAFYPATEDSFCLTEQSVQLVEPMGFDKEILFELAGKEVKARLDLRSTITAGEQIDLLVEMPRLLLFDQQGLRC